MKRLFIAINLPEQLKNSIAQIITDLDADMRRYRLKESTFRWIPKEQWHLTITFLGYQPDEAIGPILKSIKQIVFDYSNILKNNRIVFEKIILAPPGKTPRMIWLDTTKETSKTLGIIKNKLEDELVKNGVRFQRENREYHAHLTLARFRSPLINVDIISVNQRSNQRESALLAFYASSLDLMESHLKPTGVEYEILAKVDFFK